jgi:predicted GIY-YIG superfamily endonuclease
MPKKPIDYKKAIIYKICNTDETLVYIGSTTDYRKRKSKHKSTCNNENCKEYIFYVYQMIRENGGWEAFEMKPVKEFPCENKIQLIVEEERIRKELNANLNSYKSFRTQEERKEYHKEYTKEWRM